MPWLASNDKGSGGFPSFGRRWYVFELRGSLLNGLLLGVCLVGPLVGCRPQKEDDAGGSSSAARSDAEQSSATAQSRSPGSTLPQANRASASHPRDAETGSKTFSNPRTDNNTDNRSTTATQSATANQSATAASSSAATSASSTGATARRQPPQKPVQDDAGDRPWLTTAEWPYEYWEAQYLNAQRIGMTHYKVEKADGERLILTARTSLQIQRAGETISQTVSVQTIEQADGEVDSYFEEAEGDGVDSKTQGSITDELLPLKTTKGEDTSAATITWPKGTWGPMGVHQLLLRRPMRAGELRQTRVFLPQIHKVAFVTLAAGDEEDTTSPEGLLRNLLPVDVTMQLEDQGISSRLWVNSQGHVQKSVVTAGPYISSYRVPRDVAERMESQVQVDLFAATSIKLESPLVEPDKARRVDYVVESTSIDPYGMLSREGNQAARSETAFRAALTVWRPEVGSPAPSPSGQAGPKQTPPTPECSASSMMIKSDDANVQKLALVLAGEETEPAALAVKLTEGVFKSIHKKNFSRAFDTAQDVARTLEGDCTEHAVLLTALLRNRGIPARIASGVVARDTDGGSVFAYHMWTEAWVDDRWLPLDASLGGLAGCGHIKFLETPLADSNPYAALLPVMSTLGQLKISVKEVLR